MMAPEISIIVRTKNEERWISHCLDSIFNQDFPSFEVILVDNNSTDHTVSIANRFPLAGIVNVEHFIPGQALNSGIAISKGKYIVCLSAHCIPKSKDWLSTLRKNFNDDEMLAGVYGRQLPLSFTDDVDKRDLLIVFGQDRRIQIKDHFFHNANSMIRRDVWNLFPFDESVSNIEDRVWGRDVIAAGYHLIYDPDAAVYHHHGLHQGNSPKRAKGVVSVFEKIDRSIVSDLPECLKPENVNVVAIIPVQGAIEQGTKKHELISATLKSLETSKYLKEIYLMSSTSPDQVNLRVNWIDRSEISNNENLAINELLKEALINLEARGSFPEAILYVNYDYINRPSGIYDELIFDAQYKGYDTIFTAYPDYGHFWRLSSDGEYFETDSSMQTRSRRESMYRALYGLGCLTSSALIRSGKMVGGKVGILISESFENALRYRVN